MKNQGEYQYQAYRPFLRMGPTVRMCSFCSLYSELILLLCGQFYGEESNWHIEAFTHSLKISQSCTTYIFHSSRNIFY